MLASSASIASLVLFFSFQRLADAMSGPYHSPVKREPLVKANQSWPWVPPTGSCSENLDMTTRYLLLPMEKIPS
jgi:hypothetical protein